MEALKLDQYEGQEEQKLKREIGLKEAIAMVVGIVIGSGIFFKTSTVLKSAGSPMMGILAWAVGGIITMASALTVSEIAAAIPKTGGVFAYLKELYGEKWAFLFGWVQTLVYVPGSAAALSIVLVTQATYFVPMTDLQQKMLAIFMLFFIMFLNILSTKLASKIQFLSTIGKMIPIIVIIALGLIKGQAHSFSAASMPGSVVSATGFGAAILGTLWAYDGWISVGNMAGELKNPKKDLPKSIVIGVIIIALVYVLINFAILNVIPAADIVNSSKPASDAAVVLFGKGGANIISAGILISIFGTLNGYVMTGVRIPFAIAQDKLLPFSGFFGKVNDKFKTPLNSYIFATVLASLYVLSGSFEMLTNLVVLVMWIFFTMTVAGIFILRKKQKNVQRSYSVPLYPIIPLVGIVGGIYIIISTITTDPTYSIFGILITIAGLPVYYYMNRKK